MLTEFRERFAPLAAELELDWKITDSAVKKRVVVLVSSRSIVSTTCSPGGSRRNSTSRSLRDLEPRYLSRIRGVAWHPLPSCPRQRRQQGACLCRGAAHFRGSGRRHHGAGALHADSLAGVVQGLPGTHHQHSSQLPAQLRRCQAVSPGLGQGREADRRYLSLRDQPSSTRARSSSRT